MGLSNVSTIILSRILLSSDDHADDHIFIIMINYHDYQIIMMLITLLL